MRIARVVKASLDLFLSFVWAMNKARGGRQDFRYYDASAPPLYALLYQTRTMSMYNVRPRTRPGGPQAVASRRFVHCLHINAMHDISGLSREQLTA